MGAPPTSLREGEQVQIQALRIKRKEQEKGRERRLTCFAKTVLCKGWVESENHNRGQVENVFDAD